MIKTFCDICKTEIDRPSDNIGRTGLEKQILLGNLGWNFRLVIGRGNQPGLGGQPETKMYGSHDICMGCVLRMFDQLDYRPQLPTPAPPTFFIALPTSAQNAEPKTVDEWIALGCLQPCTKA